ncbi:hypothetical protein GCM10007159_40190 [Modicisalibacter luteus]|nr:hypothetical protein GCM10007159_40190 [Halomonas lutea]
MRLISCSDIVSKQETPILNRSRKVFCPECSGANFWEGEPKPAASLHCRYCQAFICTYDGYIRDVISFEAGRLIAEFAVSEPTQAVTYQNAS